MDIPTTAEGSYQETGIMRLMINRSPFIAPLSVLDKKSEERLGFTRESIQRKVNEAMKCPFLKKEAILKAKEPYHDDVKDPDLTIYSSFPSDHDKGVMASWRQVARNWPEVLPEKEKANWKNFCALRLINPPVEGTPTYELYMRTINEKIESVDTDYKAKEILMKLKEYGEELHRKVIG